MKYALIAQNGRTSLLSMLAVLQGLTTKMLSCALGNVCEGMACIIWLQPFSPCYASVLKNMKICCTNSANKQVVVCKQFIFGPYCV